MNLLRWMKSGYAVVFGAAIGVYIGIKKPEYVADIAPFGTFYLDVLQMCILPILLTAISLGIGRLIKHSEDNSFIIKLVVIFICSLLSASVVGFTIGFLFEPGYLGEDAEIIGQVIYDLSEPDLQVDLFAKYVPLNDESVLKNLFFTLVPPNIFNALSNGYTIKILFFAILFGCALGALQKQAADHIFLTFDAIYQAFSRLVQWLMYVFPLGICGLLATNLSQIGTQAVSAMALFVPMVIVTFIVWFGLMCLVMKKTTGDFLGPLNALKEPVIISLTTSNAMASLPSALEAMHKNLGYDKAKIDLLIPLTFTLCRIGPTLYFSMATMFVIQLYDVDMSFYRYLLVIFGSVLAGTATAGSSGVSLLTMLGIVSGPLGVPLDAVLVLFVVIDPLIAPFRVMVIVHSSCALISLALPKSIVFVSKNTGAAPEPLDSEAR